MTPTDVTYRFEFGSAIDEAGLNAISAGLRISHPGLFTHSDTVLVKPAPPGQPASSAHRLTIYAVVKKPIAFNLYPVNQLPSLPPDSLMIQAEISFSLTDSILGLITRIDVVAQAAAKIKFTGDTASISLLSFDLVDIEADSPSQQAVTTSLSLAGDTQIANPLIPINSAFLARVSGDPLGESFSAIVQYLVELYLKDSLETVVSSFPVPSLDKLIGFGGLGQLPIGGVFIRNKAIYLMAGNDLGNPSAFPGPPATPADFRIGVSQTGLRRAIAAFLPLPVPVDSGKGTWLHLTGNLNIPTLDVSLPPGTGKTPVKVNIGGMLNLHVAVPIPKLGGTFEFNLRIPIDYLTGYTGSLFPTLKLESYTENKDADITIGLAPDVGFLSSWVAFVATDYRDYLAQKFEDAIHNGISRLLGKKFCNIPILGWFVCGVLDVSGEVLGFLVGGVIDFFISTILTSLINILGHILFIFFRRPDFSVLRIKQADVFKMTGVSIASASLALVSNGRDGDLELSGWIQDQGLPVPAEPGPVTPLPAPQPPPAPPYPGAPALTEYSPADFLPAFALPNPAWSDGLRQAYTISVTSADHPAENADYAAQFLVEQVRTGWRLSLITHTADGTMRAECHADYDAQSLTPLSLQRVSYGSATAGTLTARQSVDLSKPGQAAGSFGVDGAASLQLVISIMPGVFLECEDFWVFRLAHSALSQSASAKLGTIAVTDPHSASNWVREIPIVLVISDGALDWAPLGEAPTNVPVWIVTANEETKHTVAQIAKDGLGLLRQTVTTSEGEIVMIRQ